jgi:hypothetical protein
MVGSKPWLSQTLCFGHMQPQAGLVLTLNWNMRNSSAAYSGSVSSDVE